MKFFIDTADIKEIREAAAMGLVDGVTTNPSLVSKTGKKFRDVLLEICDVVKGPVSAEVTSTNFDGMMKEAREYAALRPNIVVKIPLIAEGLKAVRACSDEGIKVNVTLCFSATQALLAAKAGATYISPFVGRLDDISTDGMQLIGEIVQIYDNYAFATEVLVASVRGPMHVQQAALLGAHVATCPLSVLLQLCRHPLTDSGLEKFLKDWEKVPEVIRGLLLVLAAASCADDGGPRLDSVTPSAAARNAMVSVTGQHLCGVNADCAHAGGEIVLGLSPPQVHANVVTYTDDHVELVIPAITAVGTTHLIATVDERSSNALAFEVLP